jgi:ribose 5-phosphate isomerase B
MSIAANKINGIRAALCSDSFSTRFTRLHNDSNVMCMGARTLGPGLACELAEIFLTTGFEGGRHKRRVDLITEIEKKN